MIARFMTGAGAIGLLISGLVLSQIGLTIVGAIALLFAIFCKNEKFWDAAGVIGGIIIILGGLYGLFGQKTETDSWSISATATTEPISPMLGHTYHFDYSSRWEGTQIVSDEMDMGYITFTKDKVTLVRKGKTHKYKVDIIKDDGSIVCDGYKRIFSKTHDYIIMGWGDNQEIEFNITKVEK